MEHLQADHTQVDQHVSFMTSVESVRLEAHQSPCWQHLKSCAASVAFQGWALQSSMR